MVIGWLPCQGQRWRWRYPIFYLQILIAESQYISIIHHTSFRKIGGKKGISWVLRADKYIKMAITSLGRLEDIKRITVIYQIFTPPQMSLCEWEISSFINYIPFPLAQPPAGRKTSDFGICWAGGSAKAPIEINAQLWHRVTKQGLCWLSILFLQDNNFFFWDVQLETACSCCLHRYNTTTSFS